MSTPAEPFPGVPVRSWSFVKPKPGEVIVRYAIVEPEPGKSEECNLAIWHTSCLTPTAAQRPVFGLATFNCTLGPEVTRTRCTVPNHIYTRSCISLMCYDVFAGCFRCQNLSLLGW